MPYSKYMCCFILDENTYIKLVCIAIIVSKILYVRQQTGRRLFINNLPQLYAGTDWVSRGLRLTR